MPRWVADFALQALAPPASVPWGQSRGGWVLFCTSLLIGISSAVIAATLGYMVWRGRELPFKRTALAFGAFIVGGGLTFGLSTLSPQHPTVDLLLRVFTALAALCSAAMLLSLVPKVI